MKNNHPNYNKKIKEIDNKEVEENNNGCYKTSSPSNPLAFQSLSLLIVSVLSN